MRKIKFKGVSMNLIGDVDLQGKKLNIKAIDKNGNLKNLADYQSEIKVLSTFPKLNTSVCDNQTKEIAKLANKYTNVDFISLTMDSAKKIKKWCLAHSLDNLVILSDNDHREFSEATNLLIKKLKMLARGFIVLGPDNLVHELFYKEEITDEPMFKELEIFLEKLLNK